MARALSDYPELAQYMDGPGRDPKDTEPVRPMRRADPLDPTWMLARWIELRSRPGLGRGPQEVEAER